MPTYISLLRGINVGGNKIIKMADLKLLYQSLGYSAIQTLLQSGNVVFESEQTDANAIITHIETGIQERFGFESRIILRTSTQWQTIFADNPFGDDMDANKRVVMCLNMAPEREVFERFAQGYTGEEQLSLHADNLYLYYPDGLGRSKLTHTLIEKQLGVIGTVRNWNTVTKLQGMITP